MERRRERRAGDKEEVWREDRGSQNCPKASGVVANFFTAPTRPSPQIYDPRPLS